MALSGRRRHIEGLKRVLSAATTNAPGATRQVRHAAPRSTSCSKTCCCRSAVLHTIWLGVNAAGTLNKSRQYQGEVGWDLMGCRRRRWSICPTVVCWIWALVHAIRALVLFAILARTWRGRSATKRLLAGGQQRLMSPCHACWVATARIFAASDLPVYTRRSRGVVVSLRMEGWVLRNNPRECSGV